MGKKQDIRICIGIPTTGVVKTKTVFSIIRMLKFSTFKYDIVTKESCVLHWSREQLVRKAIEGGCSHILFIDSDMFFEADAVERLLKRDKDIIGVNYYLRQTERVSTLKNVDDKGNRIWEEQPDGLLKCAAVGTGLLLIKTSVFEKLTKPWFFWESDENGDAVMGEDGWFCRNARQAGFDIYADLSIEVKHIGDFLF